MEQLPDCVSLIERFIDDSGITAGAVLGWLPPRAMKPQLTWAHGWPARATVHHRMARFGDPGVSYSYKGKPKPIDPLPSELGTLRDLVAAAIGVNFNCVVVNSYEAGAGLHPHRDGQYIPELGDSPTIAMLSLGEARTFQLHPLDVRGKRTKGRTIDVVLPHGSLLVMSGDCDRSFHHGIPEEPDRPSLRVSLTLRHHRTLA